MTTNGNLSPTKTVNNGSPMKKEAKRYSGDHQMVTSKISINSDGSTGLFTIGKKMSIIILLLLG